MGTKADSSRKRDKAEAIVKRISDMGDNLGTLLELVSEHQLDSLILALGIGHIELDNRA